jgi:GNAT superfamily N-acetyltransferase
MSGLTVVPADRSRWSELLDLFGDNGAYSNCWCTWWLLTGTPWRAATPSERRDMLHELVESGDPPPGLLAFDGDRPVGWVAVGPRDRYARMTSPRARTFRQIDDRPSWVINCFYVDEAARGRGVASTLFEAAITNARDHGATLLEGYPIDRSVDDTGPGGLFVGTLTMFQRAGFTEVARVGKRPLVRMEL